MPTLDENKSAWNHTYHWSDAGEEWSIPWGISHMQWYGTILPRIHTFLPASTILEIASGFGKWTKFLKDCCTHLITVDLSDKCIQACQERFANCSHISYFINDGRSLDMVPDHAVDFIFSFDSLVHAEDEIILSYISQVSRKLTQNGSAFIHHSNLREYSSYLKMQSLMSRVPGFFDFMTKLGVVDNVMKQWRTPSMTTRKMRLFSEDNGLRFIRQKLVAWNTKIALIDCISIIVREDSIWPKNGIIFKNKSFMREAKNLFNLKNIYDLKSLK